MTDSCAHARRRVGRSLLLLVALLLGYAASSGYAAPPAAAEPAVVPAHSALISVTPADGAVLDTGPSEIIFVFNENISPTFAQVALSRSGTVVPTSPLTITGPELKVTVDPRPGPGDYRVAYRVVSADGHPISGESTFTVRGDAQTEPSARASSASNDPTTRSTASPPPETNGPAAAPSAESSSTGSGGLLIGGLGLIVAAAGIGFWLLRRP